MSELLFTNSLGDGIDGGTGGIEVLDPRAGGEMDDGTGGIDILSPIAVAGLAQMRKLRPHTPWFTPHEYPPIYDNASDNKAA